MDEIKEALALSGKSITLVDKIFGPRLTRRQADADAQAILQGALAEQIATQLEHSPNDPQLLEAIASCGGKTNFNNLVRIAQRAIPQMTGSARPDLITDDWGANFKDKARTCFDPDMATLWAQLLAGEANHPGSYSRKAVNVLGDMEPGDARSFSDLCRFQIMVYGGGIERIPLVLKVEADIYTKHGITRSSLLTLHDLQLINFAGIRLGAIGLGASVEFSFFAHSNGMVGLVSDDGKGKLCQVDLGDVSFTKTGVEISNLCLPLRTPAGFVDFLVSEWGDRLRGFSVERWPMTVNFPDCTLQARSDLGRIVELGHP